MASVTRSILVYSNCQGEELIKTGNHMPSLVGRVGFKWIPLHLVTPQDWPTRYGPDFMAGVEVLWEQVEAGPPSVHRQELHQRLPSGCQVLRFPPYNALCLWPFAGNDPRIAADPLRYPWPDSIAAALATEELSDDALFERYMEITTQRMPDLERRLRLDVTRWQAADALSDIKSAPWVERHFRDMEAVPHRGSPDGRADPFHAAATAGANGNPAERGADARDARGYRHAAAPA